MTVAAQLWLGAAPLWFRVTTPRYVRLTEVDVRR